MIDTITICGIPHKINYEADIFAAESVRFGEIDHMKQTITINKDMPNENKEETLTHEILHGICVRLGRDDLNCDEQFITAFSNAIYQIFKIRE